MGRSCAGWRFGGWRAGGWEMGWGGRRCGRGELCVCVCVVPRHVSVVDLGMGGLGVGFSRRRLCGPPLDLYTRSRR